MTIIHEIPAKIIKDLENGQSIYSLANKIGFAYSAVYKWVHELERYGLVSLSTRKNKSFISFNKNLIYSKYKELNDEILSVERDEAFWHLMKNLKIRARFARGTAATIWTQGGFVTGDFHDKVYFLEVDKRDVNKLKKYFEELKISYTEKEIKEERPLVYIIPKRSLKIEVKNGFPVLPLSELVQWCKRLYLENILEQLSNLYSLNLRVKYSEVATNA